MILIKGAQIIDGTGKAPFKGEILIKDDRISAIGSFPNQKAETVIDGLGLTVTPGFIDVHATSDHYLSLFTNPLQKDFLLQGVTTILGGNCGSSLAPIFYGSLKSIRKWADINQVNVDWATVLELKSTLRRLKLGVNFATLIGHSTVRRDLVGEQIRDLTQTEIEVFKDSMMLAMREGALGLSTGLAYAHSRNVSYSEIKNLLSIVSKYKGIYATHLRDEKENIVDSVEEVIKIAEETKLPTIISHLRPFKGFEDKFLNALKLIEESLAKENVYFQTNPFDVSVSPIYMFLPTWAQEGGQEKMLATITDKMHRQQITEELSKSDNNLGDLIIAEAHANPYITGKTIKEFSDSRRVDVLEGLLILMEITGMKSLLFHKNINLEILTDTLFNARSFIGSNSASLPESQAALKPERSTATFPQFLKIEASKNMPPEEAIKKLTYLPAKFFGIQKRGALIEGWAADLAMLKGQQIVNVIVNGQIAVQDGKLTNKTAGLPL